MSGQARSEHYAVGPLCGGDTNVSRSLMECDRDRELKEGTLVPYRMCLGSITKFTGFTILRRRGLLLTNPVVRFRGQERPCAPDRRRDFNAVAGTPDGTEKGGALYSQQIVTAGDAAGPNISESNSRPEWYAIQTLPRHEKSVTCQLQDAGIHTVLPLNTQVHRWSDRRKVVSLPLFPGYVFVQLADLKLERIRLLRTRGVVGFVGPRREACPIPPWQIEGVRSLLATSAEYRPHPYVAMGQRVRIRDGALQGLEGILVRIADDHSLILSIDLIHKSVAVRIEGYALETI